MRQKPDAVCLSTSAWHRSLRDDLSGSSVVSFLSEAVVRCVGARLDVLDEGCRLAIGMKQAHEWSLDENGDRDLQLVSASSSFLRLILSLRASASLLAAVILACICSPVISFDILATAALVGPS